ncbi:MAGE-domain-containing protein [Russula ochroleuca]|uniref:MAGE-domain-containing protein n=1 Tax=Russula ochroleuca TaxID=152965 RepID=A0A9P5JVE9_9AGAM|nr:MAGE-domain-containing protein [Russula ochroleuca]
MPRAGPSRSQRQPSQTQRYGRSQRRLEDEDDDEMVVQNSEDEDETGMDDTTTDLKKRATDLVRLALFHEQGRMPLRRDEITKKVMGSQRGAFKTVFEEAQNILRGMFGMELVELPTRAAAHDSAGGGTGRGEKAGTQNGGEGEDGAGGRQAVTGLRKKAVTQGSKTYILRSTLDTALIERAALTNKRILEAEAAEAPDDVDGAEHGVRTYGTLIAWNNADQLSALGILHVILALVLVSGKVISDMDLRTLLRRLRLRPPTQLALPAHSPHRSLILDAYLLQLQRQGYLHRTRIGGSGSGGASGASQKRGRGRPGGATQQGSGGGEDNDAAWEWRWGPRAMAEIGEEAIAHFVAEFMAERASGGGGSGGGMSDDEVSGRGARARREDAQRRLATLLKGVECAAGGGLSGVTT